MPARLLCLQHGRMLGNATISLAGALELTAARRKVRLPNPVNYHYNRSNRSGSGFSAIPETFNFSASGK